MDVQNIKQEVIDFCDLTLEPDVILDESDESNLSFSAKANSCSPQYTQFRKTVELIEKQHSLLQLDPHSLEREILNQCPICKKYFKRLAHHIAAKHVNHLDPERKFICHFCHKYFKTCSNLNVHLRSHTGIKPYICPICNKGFTQSGNLVHHARIHNGERPYKCPVCDRGFTQPGNLNNHIRLHNQDKPFRCHLCDKAFTQSSNLNSHIKNNHKDIQL